MTGDRPGLTLILGGARSGKSDYAEELARQLGGPVLYVATAEALDEEMCARVAVHQARRPSDWETIEIPRGVGQALVRSPTTAAANVILLDCLTLLVSNTVLAAGGAGGAEPEPGAAWDAVRTEVDSLLAAHQRLGTHLIVVSNEVGLGVVPAYSLGRIYRDCLGWANQAVARVARSVILMVAGLPLDVRALPLAWPGGDPLDTGTPAESCREDSLPRGRRHQSTARGSLEPTPQEVSVRDPTPIALGRQTSKTRLGWVGVAWSQQGIMAVTLPQASESAALHELPVIGPEMPVPPWLDVDDLMFRLRRYFEGDPVLFEDPIDPSLGTEFQRRVWDITRAIPRGGTRTYGEIAREAGSPGAARAVGQAMARNPCPVIIPCHRVVGHDGRLTGFGGGLDMKQSMLDMESANA